MTTEHFRTGNPDISYSGYPGSEFPHQCGGGYGYGGYGQYGTYESCSTVDHAKADLIGGDSCGTPPMQPIVSSCAAPTAPSIAGRCGAEGFTGAEGCAKPSWYADQSCHMPPQHCGAGSCGYYEGGEYRDHSHSGRKENFEGGCDSTFSSQHNPGCDCVACMMPYSAPYHVGPGCGRPTCRCTGDCKCGAAHARALVAGVGASVAGVGARARQGVQGLLTPQRLLIAMLIAYVMYRLFRR